MMSFAQLLASRKPGLRSAFTDDPPTKPKFIFIKPTTNSKNSHLERFSLDELNKQIEVTKSNLKLRTIDAKGKGKLEALLQKYVAELERRLALQSPKVETDVKDEVSIKEEAIKEEPIESATKISSIKPEVEENTEIKESSKKANPAIFHVSDDLMMKMQSLTIGSNDNDNTKNEKNSKNPQNPFSNPPLLPSLQLVPKSKSVLKKASTKPPEKTIKFLSLEESTELVKQRKFIQKPNPRLTVPDFSSDDDDDEDDEEDEEGFNLSDDGSQN